MHVIRILQLTVIGAVAFCTNVEASIVGDALISFPAKTDYFEIDNIAALRSLPDYSALRGRFSGETLQDAKTVLHQLNISEAQVQEIAVGSNAKAIYGLAAGAFSSKAPAVRSQFKRYAVQLLDTDMYCVGRPTCVLFLDDWMVAFGSPASLRSMLLTRQGVVTALSRNPEAARLLEAMDKTAPVRGILFGPDLQSALSDIFQQWFGSLIKSLKFPVDISGIEYSVAFGRSTGTSAHVSTMLQCSSRNAAALLAQTLNALSLLRSVTTAPAINGDGFALERAKASSVESRTYVDAEVRTSDPRRH